MHAYTVFFTVERVGKKGSPAICDDFLAVSTLSFGDTDRETWCLTSHCGSLRTRRLVFRVCASLQFVVILLCLSLVLHRLCLVCGDVQDIKYSQRYDANWFFFSSHIGLDQSLYDVAVFRYVCRCFPLVWNGTSLIMLLLSYGQFSFVIVQCIIETSR